MESFEHVKSTDDKVMADAACKPSMRRWLPPRQTASQLPRGSRSDADARSSSGLTLSHRSVGSISTGQCSLCVTVNPLADMARTIPMLARAMKTHSRWRRSLRRNLFNAGWTIANQKWAKERRTAREP
jgi:hypothetical protein